MITGVPDHHELAQTATGWLNLAWNIVIGEANEINLEFFYDLEERMGREVAERVISRWWGARRLQLNNATSLLQQSLEIFLKARIAEISPFLLIVGNPQSWPSRDKTGNVDFAEFRTLDASHLCRAAQIVSASPIPEQFVQFYSRLRKERNKIMHLNAGSVKAEVHTIILNILEAHRLLFPGQLWVEFRTGYLISTREYSDEEMAFTGEDLTHDRVCTEIAAAFHELSPQYWKLYFHFDKRKKALQCPRCAELRSKHADEWRFAQRQRDGSIRCVACLSVFTKEDYDKRFAEYFGDPDQGKALHDRC